MRRASILICLIFTQAASSQEVIPQNRVIILQKAPGQMNLQGGDAGGIVTYTPTTLSANSNEDSEIKLNTGEVELRLADDTRLRAKVLVETLDLETTYGKLSFPMTKVIRIECGLRISKDDEKAMALALGDITSNDAAKRIAGRDALLAQKEKALPALRRALAAGATGEVGAALADTEARINATLPTERQNISDRDKIIVDGSTFVGVILGDSLKVQTLAFGEQSVKLAHVRSLRTAIDNTNVDNIPIIPFPGTLNGYIGQTGKVLRFRVTAAANGGVWGTSTYTMDSYLPAAAMHAGKLKAGETGVVKVKIVASPQQYIGSNQNGITSSSYPFFQSGGFEILK